MLGHVYACMHFVVAAVCGGFFCKHLGYYKISLATLLTYNSQLLLFNQRDYPHLLKNNVFALLFLFFIPAYEIVHLLNTETRKTIERCEVNVMHVPIHMVLAFFSHFSIPIL